MGHEKFRLVLLIMAMAWVRPGEVASQDTRFIWGFVGTLNGTPLSGVLVTAEGGGAARTQQNGRFGVSAPVGQALLRYSLLGYRTDSALVEVGVDSVRFRMSPSAVALEAVEVVANLPEFERFRNESQSSAVTIGVREIRNAPALFESDVLRTIQLLPGTVSKNDYSVGFNVRGGEADQNLILLDGVTVFNPSHLGGLFSTFDAHSIESLDFYSGGFPARHGGRLSSVVDIGLRDGNSERMAVSGQVSLLTSKVLVDGPVGERSRYMVGVRRTYADAVVAAFTSEALPYYFTDLVGKYSYLLPGGGSVSLSGYWGRDDLGLDLTDNPGDENDVGVGFGWGNRLLGLNATVPYGNSVIEGRASISEFSTQLTFEPGLAQYDNLVRQISLSGNIVLHPTVEHSITLGASAETYQMDYALESVSFAQDIFQRNYSPSIFSLFADDEWRPAGWLSLRPGVRLDHVPDAEFTEFSPRILAKVFLDRTFALTGSAGRFHQAIHSIRDQEQPFTLFEFWIGANGSVPVARSDHIVLGLEKWLGAAHSVKIEGYRKTYDNLVIPNRQQDLATEEDDFFPVYGRSWGIDFLLKRHVGSLTGWLSYSYADSWRQFESTRFIPSHQRDHTLNLVLNAPGPFGSDMTVRWGYGSSLPYSGFSGEWNHRQYSATVNSFVETRREPISSGINQERYPPYSRLDLGFKWTTRAFGGILNPYLNVVNLYNRRNVFLYFFDFADSPVTRTGVSQLPLLPTFGVEFQF